LVRQVRTLLELSDILVLQKKNTKALSYYVMGQICVAKEFRGQGVFKQLYTAHRK